MKSSKNHPAPPGKYWILNTGTRQTLGQIWFQTIVHRLLGSSQLRIIVSQAYLTGNVHYVVTSKNVYFDFDLSNISTQINSNFCDHHICDDFAKY